MDRGPVRLGDERHDRRDGDERGSGVIHAAPDRDAVDERAGTEHGGERLVQFEGAIAIAREQIR